MGDRKDLANMTRDSEPDALREQAPAYKPPPETQRLIDELYREEVREARNMPPEQKLLLGEELFHYAFSITLGPNPGPFKCRVASAECKMANGRWQMAERAWAVSKERNFL